MAISAGDLTAIAATPIQPDQPGGAAVTYEPEFEAIKGEIAKIDSLKGETPNWGDVQSNALILLRTKSKDLTVASYFVLSLFRTDGYAGLAGGLAFYRDLLTNFWDTLFPEVARMRGRVAAVSWMNERVAGAITRKAATSSDHEAVKGCVEALNGINGVVAEKFGADAPSLGDLRRGLEDASRASAPAAAPAAAPAGSSSGSAAAVDSPDAALRVLRNVGNEARRALEYLLKTDPGSTIPYLTSRGLAWGSIRQLPPDRDGVTAFPPPDGTVAAGWNTMVQGGQWAALLADAEPRIITQPLWLDINYHVALALENLGHDEAREAMVDQCVALIRRFPRLLEIQYQDGRGFASDDTRSWLRSEMSARAGGGGDGEAPEVDPFVDGSREIRSLAARGKLVDAVRLAQSKIDDGANPRDRFRWRLLLAGICLDAGQTAVASVQLNTLDREIESHGLEEWEPGLSLETLQALYKCEKKLGQNGNRDSRESLQKMDRLYERLCRIDILSALALEGKK